MKRQSGTMLPLYYLSTHGIILVLTHSYGMSMYLLVILLHRRRRFCILLGNLKLGKSLRKYSIKASEAPVK